MNRRRRARQRCDLALIAAPGGHLDLLIHIARSLRVGSRVWLTSGGPRVQSLRKSGETVYVLPDLNRRHINLSNPLRAMALVLRLRPRVVLTSGAGNVVAFCLLARLFGSKVIFVETMARVTAPSATGRLLSRVSDDVFVQWAELLDHYPGASVCRPLLLEGIRTSNISPGAGTFVSVGTHAAPMNRLMAMVGHAAEAGILPKPILVQSGTCEKVSEAFVATPWMSDTAFAQAIADARYVVGHAGAGLISGALRSGRRPMLLPRRQALGEHVDDHQYQLVAKLVDLGLAVALGERITAENIKAAGAPIEVTGSIADDPDLGLEINAAVLRIVGQARG